MQKTSKIDAVNSMLISVGVRPVSTISPPQGADVAQAVHTLDEVSREIQSRGWHFNTVTQTLTPDASTSKIALPANVVRIDSQDYNVDLVQVGDFLYDEDNDTFTFGGTQKVTMVLLREWEDLPEVARGYILKRALRVYQYRVRGGTDIQSPSYDEVSALNDLEDFDSQNADYNIFRNWSVAKIIDRRGIGGGRRGLEWG